MVALKGKSIEAALNKRDESLAAILVYGPDQGLVRERSTILAQHVVSDLSDPFNFMELSDSDLKVEPGRLSDEITALSFMGGERVIRIRSHGEAANPAVKGFLEALDKNHLKPNGIVIIEEGDLSPRSTLRKGFEKSKHAASLPCYEDTPQAVRALAGAMGKDHGVRFDNDALALVTNILGDDRGITRSEIEKLLLYKSDGRANSGEVITLEDARICLVDSAGDAMDDISAQCADGLAGPMTKSLHRASLTGTNPIGILRSLQRTFSRLQQARSYMDQGANPDDAMKKLRPPVFFGEQNAFRGRLNLWTTQKLRTARRFLTEAELDAKTTGAPQREIVERTALRLTRMVTR